MDWKDMRPLLARLEKLFAVATVSRETVARVASEIVGVPIPLSAITVKKTSVSFAVHPAIKTELLLKKERLLLLLNKEIGLTRIVDVR